MGILEDLAAMFSGIGSGLLNRGGSSGSSGSLYGVTHSYAEPANTPSASSGSSVDLTPGLGVTKGSGYYGPPTTSTPTAASSKSLYPQ